MGLSASAMDRRAENSAHSNHNTGRRKPVMLIISAAIASVVIATFILAAAAVLNYEPVRQHVEFQITPPIK